MTMNTCAYNKPRTPPVLIIILLLHVGISKAETGEVNKDGLPTHVELMTGGIYEQDQEMVQALWEANEGKPDSCRTDLCYEAVKQDESRRSNISYPSTRGGERRYVQCPDSLDGTHFAYWDCAIQTKGSFKSKSDFQHVFWRFEPETQSCWHEPMSQLMKILYSDGTTEDPSDIRKMEHGLDRIIDVLQRFPNLAINSQYLPVFTHFLHHIVTSHKQSNLQMSLSLTSKMLHVLNDALNWNHNWVELFTSEKESHERVHSLAIGYFHSVLTHLMDFYNLVQDQEAIELSNIIVRPSRVYDPDNEPSQFFTEGFLEDVKSFSDSGTWTIDKNDIRTPSVYHPYKERARMPPVIIIRSSYIFFDKIYPPLNVIAQKLVQCMTISLYFNTAYFKTMKSDGSSSSRSGSDSDCKKYLYRRPEDIAANVDINQDDSEEYSGMFTTSPDVSLNFSTLVSNDQSNLLTEEGFSNSETITKTYNKATTKYSTAFYFDVDYYMEFEKNHTTRSANISSKRKRRSIIYPDKPEQHEKEVYRNFRHSSLKHRKSKARKAWSKRRYKRELIAPYYGATGPIVIMTGDKLWLYIRIFVGHEHSYLGQINPWVAKNLKLVDITSTTGGPSLCNVTADSTDPWVYAMCQAPGMFTGLAELVDIPELINDYKDPIILKISLSSFFGFVYSVQVTLLENVLGAVSLICLILTAMSYKTLRRDQKNETERILVNLCISLIMLSFMLNVVHNVTLTKATCRIVNTMRYYLIFVSLLWNGAEAVNMYLKIIKVFNSHVGRFVLKAWITAWGLPVVFVAINLLVSASAFDGEYVLLQEIQNSGECTYRCQLKKSTMYFGYLVPMCVIIALNMIVFGIVTVVMSKHAKKGKNQFRARLKQLTGGLTLLMLLGFPWIFSVFGAFNTKLSHKMTTIQGVMQLVFAVTVNLQGIFIFVFYCIKKQQVRDNWKNLIFSTSIQKKTY